MTFNFEKGCIGEMKGRKFFENKICLCATNCIILVWTSFKTFISLITTILLSLVRYILQIISGQKFNNELSLQFNVSIVILTHLHWNETFIISALLFSMNFQGAPEGILDRCTHVRVGANKVPMSPAIKNEIMKHVASYGTGMH